jgi:hypothetical protein
MLAEKLISEYPLKVLGIGAWINLSSMKWLRILDAKSGEHLEAEMVRPGPPKIIRLV